MVGSSINAPTSEEKPRRSPGEAQEAHSEGQCTEIPAGAGSPERCGGQGPRPGMAASVRGQTPEARAEHAAGARGPEEPSERAQGPRAPRARSHRLARSTRSALESRGVKRMEIYNRARDHGTNNVEMRNN